MILVYNLLYILYENISSEPKILTENKIATQINEGYYLMNDILGLYIVKHNT